MDQNQKLYNQAEKQVKSNLRKGLEILIRTHKKYYEESKNDIQLGILEGLKSALKLLK